ncbi:MAG: glycosyltransferase [Sumerlaeia bacterium]
MPAPLLLLLGLGPYPTEPGAGVSGPGIRVRQFAEPLRAAGFEVVVGLCEARAEKAFRLPGGMRAFRATPDVFESPGRLAKGLGPLAGRVDAVLGVGSLMPAAAAAMLGEALRRPAWSDLFGDPLAELHGEETAPNSPASENHPRRDQVWKLMRETLLRADAFSTVSERQRDALLGQLLLLGRWGGAADPGPEARIHCVPCAVPASWAEAKQPDPDFPEALAERGLAPETPFVFVGGSWTPWLAAREMGAALRRLLEDEPEAWVVIRGGPARGIAGPVCRTFNEALGESDRVVALAPGDADEAALLAHARAALLLDRPIAESRLGSRNRLLAFARWGLPTVASVRAEVAADLAAEGLVLAADPSDGELTVAALREAVGFSVQKRRALQRKGRAYLERVTYEATLAPVLDWLRVRDRWQPPVERASQQIAWATLPAGDRALLDRLES